MKNFIITPVNKLFPALFWIFVWQGAYMLINKEILIVSPFDVFVNLAALSVTAEFWIICSMSLLRVLTGFFSGVAAGVATAVLCSVSKTAFRLLQPLNVVVKSTPVASFIILTLVYMRTWTIPAFTSFIMVFPGIWTGVYEGIKNTDLRLLEMAKIFKLSKWRTVKTIYIPSVAGYFVSAFTLGAGLAWKAAIAAEILARPKPSVGAMLNNAKIYLDTLNLFTWTAVVIILSMAIEVLLVKAVNKLSSRFLYGTVKS